MGLRAVGAFCAVAGLLSYSSSLALQSQDQSLREMRFIAGGPTVLGDATTYNPLHPGYREGGLETASGELYDPYSWTAAIQIDMRDKFGGVGYGRLYRPSYALVVNADKKAIVRINDVGPLLPGRIIDLNEQSMHFFDPSMQQGVLHLVQVTPLAGEEWSAGPVDSDE